MGVVSRTLDKLPTWARVALGIIAILMSMYYVARYGLFSFLIRMIFSPDP